MCDSKETSDAQEHPKTAADCLADEACDGEACNRSLQIHQQQLSQPEKINLFSPTTTRKRKLDTHEPKRKSTFSISNFYDLEAGCNENTRKDIMMDPHLEDSLGFIDDRDTIINRHTYSQWGRCKSSSPKIKIGNLNINLLQDKYFTADDRQRRKRRKKRSHK